MIEIICSQMERKNTAAKATNSGGINWKKVERVEKTQ
jgi:hypothetical protein